MIASIGIELQGFASVIWGITIGFRKISAPTENERTVTGMAVKLTFGDKSAYTYYNLDSRTESELRKEYSRLRAIANKRITRLEKAGFGESPILERYGQGFTKTSSIAKGDIASIKKALYELVWFSSDERSTVSGERKAMAKEIGKLRESGYDFVTTDNYYKFKRFMQEMRDSGMIDAYGSNRIVEIFPEVKTPDKESAVKTVKKMFGEYIEDEEDGEDET